MLHTFHMFNRYGDCIYNTHWRRDSPEQEGECKLVGGLIYSLQQVMKQLSTLNAMSINSMAGLSTNGAASAAVPTGQASSSSNGVYRALHTTHYKLHYFESVSGYRMSLTTVNSFPTDEGQRLLEDIFRSIFVEHVVRDVRYKHAEGVVITTPQFETELNRLLRERKLV
eukprot:GILI01048405.1.p1 GENE.GILI01048405.1~~GILI01048405.1.p1  ORF type:complete len:177 (+),score=8.97 GILI01048405.1:27-533(+)